MQNQVPELASEPLAATLASRLQKMSLVEFVHPLMHFLAVNANLGRGRNANPHLFPINRRNSYADTAGNNDFFADSSSKDKHGSPP
jgi:hypothetical protein